MSANVGAGARKLGEKLLEEIEVESLSSVSRYFASTTPFIY